MSALETAYLGVIDDLRKSDFVRRRGLTIEPQHYHIAELGKIIALAPKGGRVLDIGTGAGIVPETLLRLGYSVVTVDLARNEKGREPLERLVALGAEGHFAAVGLDPVPIPDDSVDVAFAGDVIEHLPGSPRHFLREILRLLKPGGYIVLTTPNAVRLAVRLRVLLGYSNWPPVSIYIENPPDPPWHAGHHHEYTSCELTYVLKDGGFEEPSVEFIEDTLRRRGIIRSKRDIATQDRTFAEYWKARHRFHPMELARLGMLGIVTALPRLRSIMLATARKPVRS